MESRHRVSASLRFNDGRENHTFGGSEARAYWRSALKPFQGLVVVDEGVIDAFDFDTGDLAVICASHGGTPAHTERVSTILDRIGRGEPDLHCGPHAPYDSESAERIRMAGGLPSRLHNNCSGKHASMLALALHKGWDIERYWTYEHKVQARMREGLADWVDADPETLEWGTDGCGVPTPLIRLADMAGAYCRLADRARQDGSSAGAVVEAMTTYPELTSSPGREPLRIMQGTSGRLLAKEGAEGVLCIAGTDDGWGLALKVEDGSRRAVGPAAISILNTAGLLLPEELEALSSLAETQILSTRDDVVGSVRSAAPIVLPAR